MGNAACQKRKSWLRAAAVAALVVLVLFAVAATVLAAGLHSHECAGHRCESCLQLRWARQLLGGLLWGTLALAAGLWAYRGAVGSACYTMQKQAATLVGAKVQFNN